MDIVKTVVDALTSFKKLTDFKDWVDDKRYAKRDDSRAIARRVLQVFDVHNISVAKIPIIFHEFNFKICDFNGLDSTASVLTPEFLGKLSCHFFINQEWLETGIGGIQEVYEYGYDFEAMYSLIMNFNPEEDESLIAYFIARKGIKFVPAYDHSTDDSVVVVIEINYNDENSGLKYSRYLPLYSGYWHYYKTRMMLKSISLLLFQDKKIITQKGFFYKNLNGECFQNEFASNLVTTSHGSWYPDDYIFCNGQSAQEKDPDDARLVHQYLSEINFYQKLARMRHSKFIDQK